MRRIACGMAAVLVMAAAGSVAAQKTTEVHPGKGGSPHVRTDWTIDGANISIEYGRPFLKGRPEAGEGRMEVGKPWRTGADEATVIKTDKALKFGTLSLEPGSYTINTQPGDKDWQLIIGKLGKPGQWGVPYNATLEIGRAPMALGTAKSPVEQVTISIDDTPKGGTLKIEWGTKVATIPFTVG
jgi:Protein of unknown function (DUF2911)